MLMMILQKHSDAVGMIGVVLFLVSYLLLNTHVLCAKNLAYQLMNFFGSWFVLFSLYFNWNTPAATIEICWVLISIVGIYNAVAAKRIKTPSQLMPQIKDDNNGKNN